MAADTSLHSGLRFFAEQSGKPMRCLHPSKSEHFWPRLCAAPRSTKNRCGFRGDRLRPPSALRFTPPPLLCRGLARSISPLVTNYLRISISACLTDTSGEPTVSVRYNSNATRKPPLAIPTCKDRHLLSGLQSARAAIRIQPPTRQRTDERTVFRPRHSPDLSPRAGM